MVCQLKLMIVLLLSILSFPELFARYKSADPCTAFALQIHAQSPPTDTVRLLYRDCENRDAYKDTLVLSSGRATEAILFADLKKTRTPLVRERIYIRDDQPQESVKPDSMNTDNPFIGVWELVSWTARQSDGRLVYPYGADAIGQLLYDAGGNVMVEIMKKERPLFASNDFLHGSTEEITAAYNGFMAYSGTYDINPAAGTVTHHVRIGSFPNWVGHDQVRHYTFRDDLLILKSPTMGTAQHELTWKRVKPATNR